MAHDMLAAVLATSLDSIVVMDEAGLVLEFNPAAERTFGYTRAELLGRPLGQAIVPPVHRAAHEQGLRRLVAGGQSRVVGRRVELSGMRKGGHTFPVELTITELRRVEGRVFLAYLRDVTERRASEAALQESEARFRALVDDQTEVVFKYDAAFQLEFANTAACRLHGASLEELKGRHIRSTIPDAIWATLEPALRSLRPDRPLHHQQNAKQLHEGEERWFAFSNRALFDAAGHVTGYLAVGHDITQQRAAEAEIERQRDHLFQSEKLAALGSLLAGVAHELNNPLSVVLARAVMLEEEPLAPEHLRSVTTLRLAAERCARIVRSFLAVARQKPRVRRTVHVETMLAAVLELLAYALRTADVEVVQDWRAGAGGLVQADEDALHQVFCNLVMNAQQALLERPAPRRLHINTRRRKGWIEVAFGDNGPGVPAAIRSRIFEPFFTTKPEGAGTGIGLAVCHSIVTVHGGTIEFGQRPGGGARFIVRLPLAAGSPWPEAMRAIPAGATESERSRVLVVDDEPDLLEILHAVFAREGHAVTVAGDGREALQALRATPFDLLVTDLRMPGLDGRGLLRAVKRLRVSSRPAVIVLSGDTLSLQTLEAGFEPRPTVLEKPIDPAVLRATARQLLAARQTGTSAS